MSEKKEYFECNDENFELIHNSLICEGTVAFNFCPNKYSQFGVVLSCINYNNKLTKYFSGLHPSLGAFLFVAIERIGGFGFNLSDRKEKFYSSYISEKLMIPEEDANGFCGMLNYFLKRWNWVMIDKNHIADVSKEVSDA